METMDFRYTDFLTQLCGIDVLKYDESFVLKSIHNRAKAVKCISEEDYLHFLLKNEEEKDLFTRSLSINYSDFFRNQLTFSILENFILPSVIAQKSLSKNRTVRAWSAACASGQEAYSLAMLMEEMVEYKGDDYSYILFATDQDETVINEAVSGKYHTDSIKNLPMKYARRWFSKDGNYDIINPELKKNIAFSVFNLLDDRCGSPPEAIFGDFDIIICANLLFYYKDEYRKIILDKLTRSLARGGFLVTSEAERGILSEFKFREAFPKSCIFQTQ
jgi:chemotaxis protein methyltransferase CheR